MIHVDPEFSALIPPLQADELAGLEASLQADGCRDALVVWRGKDILLDGHNRKAICDRLGISYQTKAMPFADRLDAMIWIRTNQASRRNLTDSQRGMNAALLAELEIEKSKRDRAKAGRAAGGKATVEQKADRSGTTVIPKRSQPKPRAVEKASKTANVPERKIKQALAVHRADPVLAQKVLSGEVTLTKATQEVKKQKHAETLKGQQALPSDKYRVIYADPPWFYGDSREGLSSATGATAHYPTMAIDELCNLRIRDLADDNAVLFMWVTSPLLEECFAVIKAWGFKYKASFIWDKVAHNLGHYNSVRHELLLICTRGSCLPDSSKLIDSVQSIEKTRKHSEKPEAFRAIINTMYTSGRKIELFARGKIEGWESWGNEA